MKSVILRLGLILSFLGCVVVIVGVLPSFEWRVVFLLMLIVAGVWGILLKPSERNRYDSITVYNQPANDKTVLDFMRDLTHKS